MPKYLAPLLFLAISIPCVAQSERKCFIIPCQSKLATTLTAAHMALAFADTWQTQRNHDTFSGEFVEYDPLTRPFQTHGKPLAYASTAVATISVAFIADKMRRSNNRVLRRTWWVPQVLFIGANAWGLSGSVSTYNSFIASRR